MAVSQALILLSVLACSAYAVDYAGSDVIDLTPTNFQSRVIDSEYVWIIEFYAPWCGHCKSLAPEWKKAATALKGIVKVGAVNADSHQSLGGQYGVRGFPTIKIFGANKNSPTDYQGARSASGIVQGGLDAARQVANARLSGGGGSSSSSGGSGSRGSGSGSGGNDVVELTESNFNELVMQSSEPWLVEFFAPWCGHCKSLEPQWKRAATDLKGKVKLGAVDATVHQSLSSRYGVQGFPTIKFFPAGDKSSPEDYQGGRTASDIVSFGESKALESVEPPKVEQLVGQESFEACTEKQLCTVAFLPHILDSGAEGRNNYITLLQSMADKYKARPFGWLWSEGAVQTKLEEAVDVGGFGYPALVTISAKKLKYAPLRGAFSKTGINEFLQAVTIGRGSTQAIRGSELPKIYKSEPWDGKDGEIPAEDDIDLSDVSLDDEPSKDEL
ncbi:protein disulfide-isomerase A6-like [Sycon ciliatum]|uniref:protein disulfide-isomerase A6-like n=1 Tax=Sycon ciliatum TaxID=27933 RepID=UPI0031F71804|eukprot:scpid50940/ scgid7209/ Protein disulfide-isomerase A6; Calcium-binding protein 1; Protein disulfide isomerase P5; Thioredoxin domain-containing protein 7